MSLIPLGRGTFALSFQCYLRSMFLAFYSDWLFPISLITFITHWTFGITALFRQLPSSSQGSPFDDPLGSTISILTKTDVRNDRTDVPDIKQRITIWWHWNVVCPQQAEKPFLENVLAAWLEVFGADNSVPVMRKEPLFTKWSIAYPNTLTNTPIRRCRTALD